MAVNVADVWPAGTVTLAGTVRLVLLEESATEDPPVGAAEPSETEQEVVPGVLIVPDVQETEVTCALGSEMLPDPPVALILFPAPSEATTPVNWRGIGLADGDAAIWKVAVATVPPGIVVVFSPNTMHDAPLQETLLPAALAALPVVTVTLVMSEEKPNDHCRAAGSEPPADDILTERETVPPGVLDPELMDRLTLWPIAST